MNSIESTPARVTGTQREDVQKKHRQLRGDLDNIILKALRKEPGRRYASAEQLAEDIRRHLDGLPISAAPDSIWYRTNKFARRHKAGVAVALLFFIAIVGGVIATLTEARIAKTNERRAERRFNDVRKLANSLMFEVHDSIQNLPGATPARKLIIERASEYLDSLAQESGGDPSLQSELASAYRKVGDVQGYPFRSNLGDSAGALRSYQKALAIRELLLRSNPDDLPNALELTIVYRRLAEMHSVNQDISSAVTEAQKAQAIGERLSVLHPKDAQVLEYLIKDDLTLAGIEAGNLNSANLGNTTAALALYQKASTIGDQLATQKPKDSAVRQLLAGTYLRFGDQLLQLGEQSAAGKQYLRGTEILTSLYDPQNQTSIVDLAEADSRVGGAEASSGEIDNALQTYLKELSLYQFVVKSDPDNTNALLGFALAYANVGETESMLGQHADGLSSIKTGLSILDKTVSDSSTADMRNTSGIIRVMMGAALAWAGKHDEALRYYRQSLSIFERMNHEDRSNLDSLLCLGATYDKVGTALLQLGDVDQATAAFQSGLKLAAPQATSDQFNAQAIYVVADSYTGLGNTAVAMASTKNQPRKGQIQQWQKAQSFFQESLHAWSRIKEPGNFSPEGFQSMPPASVQKQVERCQEILRKLKA